MPKNEDDLHVVLDGKIAELVAKISPDTYQKYVHHKRAQAHIYCKLNVSLYGTLKAAILFGRNYQRVSRRWASQSTHMNGVLESISSTDHNAQ